MDDNVVENFYGVYLLYCLNPQFLGRTYIGYTVDPNRRIKQHNKGRKHGGAFRTNNRGPWTMVMIIHGFPNDISALRFEWAWQHPHSSRRLQHVQRKRPREKLYEFCVRVLSEMLAVGPWNRLPLTIRWLNQEYIRELNLTPPMHMPICYGPVISTKLKVIKHKSDTELTETKKTKQNCDICHDEIIEKKLQCLNSECDLVCHIVCLSKYFLEDGQYVPVEGTCPLCSNSYLWGDVIKKYKGCYQSIDLKINFNAEEFCDLSINE